MLSFVYPYVDYMSILVIIVHCVNICTHFWVIMYYEHAIMWVCVCLPNDEYWLWISNQWLTGLHVTNHHSARPSLHTPKCEQLTCHIHHDLKKKEMVVSHKVLFWNLNLSISLGTCKLSSPQPIPNILLSYVSWKAYSDSMNVSYSLLPFWHHKSYHYGPIILNIS